jgi:hypothetical protein
MASILILTQNKRGLSLANRLAREDNLVKVTHEVKAPFEHSNLTSLYNPVGLIDQFDLCLCLSPAHGDWAELAIETKVPTLFGCKFIQKLYSDRQFYERTYALLVKKPQNFDTYDGAWFDGNSFCLPYKVNQQHRLMDGDRGPVLGSTIFNYSIEAEAEKKKWEIEGESTGREFLKKIGYLGPVQGPIPLGFTPISFAFLETCYKVFPTLMAIAHGEEFKVRHELVSGVKITFPSLELASEVELNQDSIKHVDWFSENELYVTARGENPRECNRRIKRTLEQLNLSPEAMYRSDF